VPEETPRKEIQDVTGIEDRANRVTGWVLVAETGAAVPGVSIVLHALNAAHKNRSDRSTEDPGHGVRLGSTVTDAGGAFEFAFADTDFDPPVRAGGSAS